MSPKTRRILRRSVFPALVLSGLAVLSAAPAQGQTQPQGYRDYLAGGPGPDARHGRLWGPELIAYPDQGFRGRGLRIAGPVGDLSDTWLNDQISSLEIRAGVWEVCADPGYRGRCEIVRGDLGNAHRIGLNDRISSLRPVRADAWDGRQGGRYLSPRPGPDPYVPPRGRGPGDGFGGKGRPGALTLFVDPNGRGRALTLDGPVYHLNDFRFNDVASSLRVRGQGAWQVCEHPGFRGRCRIVDGSVFRLNDIGMNDNITSARPVSGPGYRH